MNLLIVDFLFVDAHRDMNISFLYAIARFAKINVISLNGFYNPFLKEFKKRDISVHNISLRRSRGLIGSRIFSLKLMLKEVGLLKFRNYDAILCLGFETTVLGLIIRKLQRIPLILFHHKNIDELTNKLKLMIFNSYKNKVYHVVFEDFFGERLIEYARIHKNKVFVIPHPVKAMSKLQMSIKYDCIGLCNSNDESFVTEVFKRFKEFRGLHLLLRSKYEEGKTETVEIVKGFMPDHVYNDLMNSGRTVFVPLPKSYIYRLSGSIYDALSRGKIVYTNSKFYSNEYERRYPGICVYVGSVDDLIFQLEKKEEPYVIESFQKFLNDHSIERVGNEIKKMVTKVLK